MSEDSRGHLDVGQGTSEAVISESRMEGGEEPRVPPSQMEQSTDSAGIPEAGISEPDVPKADVPEADVPEADVPEADVPEADVPKANVPEADVPKADVPEADVPKVDVPEADVPKVDVPKADVPKTDVPKADVPDIPEADVPDIPKADIPEAGLPEADVPEGAHPEVMRTEEVIPTDPGNSVVPSAIEQTQETGPDDSISSETDQTIEVESCSESKMMSSDNDQIQQEQRCPGNTVMSSDIDQTKVKEPHPPNPSVIHSDSEHTNEGQSDLSDSNKPSNLGDLISSGAEMTKKEILDDTQGQGHGKGHNDTVKSDSVGSSHIEHNKGITGTNLASQGTDISGNVHDGEFTKTEGAESGKATEEPAGTGKDTTEARTPREFETLWGLLSQIPRKAQRGLLMQCDLILTCVSADDTYIAMGTNIGLLFLYNRKKQTVERLKTENPSDVVTCIKLHHGLDYQIAVGMASGSVSMFLLPSIMTGLNKQLQKFLVNDVHLTYLTSVEWSTNGMRLFSGDKRGMVVSTEIDFEKGQCKSTVLLIESSSEIVQLHYDHKALLVSTKQRSIICRLDDRDRIAQIGQQDRKILGGFGACFIPGMCKTSDAEVYAARPGCRIWRSDITGVVTTTHMFKDLVGTSNPEIPVLKPEKGLIVQEPQFGKVHIYRENLLLTWSPLGLFVLDPGTNKVIAHSDRLGYIVDVAVYDDEIFVLRHNTEASLVRLAEKAEVPIVKTILASIPSSSPYRSLASPLRDSHVITPPAQEKDSKHSSPSAFFKKNIFGKLKFLDFTSDHKSSKGSDLQQEVSVKQLIDSDDNSETITVITSPDLPPVIRINSPELTALQVFEGVAGSPMSPEGGPEREITSTSSGETTSAKSAATSAIAGVTTSANSRETVSAKSGETTAKPRETIVVDAPGYSAMPVPAIVREVARTDLHYAEISDRVHITGEPVGDIVFQHKKKHKKKKHKTERHRLKDDDEISQNSDSGQNTVDSSDISISREATPKHILKVADEILKDTLDIINKQEAAGADNKTHTDDQKMNLTADAESSSSIPSNDEVQFDPKSVPYLYKLDNSSLPVLDNSDKVSQKLNRMAQELSSGQESNDLTPSVSSDADLYMPRRDEDTPSVHAHRPTQSPLSPSQNLSAISSPSDASTEDFYKKYMSQTSVDSNAPVSPTEIGFSSPDAESDQPGGLRQEADASITVATPAGNDRPAAGTLLKLANSWSEVMTPANVYSLVVSERHVWFTDKSDNIHYSSLNSAQGLVWKKSSGRARQIAVSSNGAIVWRLHKNTVFTGTKLSAKRPEGMKWVESVKDVDYIAVDDTCAWYIKTNGEVMMQKNLSAERPCFKSELVPSGIRLKQVVCHGGVVWAITENHKLVYRTGITERSQTGTEWREWGNTMEILFASVSIGDQETGWAVDVVGRIWFCCGVTMAMPCGDGRWWQVPMSEYFVQDHSALDVLKSLASKFDPQKLSFLLSTSRGGLITAGPQGVWVCLEYKNVMHVCRGSFQGYSWQDANPHGMAPSNVWKTVSANTSDLEWGLVWAQQPNGELYVFPANTRKAMLVSPSPLFSCLHAGPIAAWGLDLDCKVWVRSGMGPYCPQGASWAELDLSQLGDAQLIHVSCNSQFVWAVDCEGLVYQRIGAKAPSDQVLSPAWLPIDSFSEISFTSVVTGALEWMVWAVDNRRLSYVRHGITDRMPIGREWVHVPGSPISELVVTKSGVWALNPEGEVMYRYGITRDNVCGNYWKKVPGVFAHLSASPNDDLWAISREGHLLQCHTKHLRRRQFSNDVVARRSSSVGNEEGEGEWELV